MNCPYCHKEHNGHKYCPHCMRRDTSIVRYKNKKLSRLFARELSVCIIVILVFSCLVVLMRWPNDQPPENEASFEPSVSDVPSTIPPTTEYPADSTQATETVPEATNEPTSEQTTVPQQAPETTTEPLELSLDKAKQQVIAMTRSALDPRIPYYDSAPTSYTRIYSDPFFLTTSDSKILNTKCDEFTEELISRIEYYSSNPSKHGQPIGYSIEVDDYYATITVNIYLLGGEYPL